MTSKLIGAAACGVVAVIGVAAQGGTAGATGLPAGAGSGAVAAAHAKVTARKLPLLPDSVRSLVTAMSPDGAWLGGSIDTADGRRHLVLWNNAQITDLTGDITLADPQITAVEAGGFAAGQGMNADGHGRGFMISGGGFFELPVPAPDDSAQVAGVDPVGDVAGTVTDSAGRTTVVVWPGTAFGTVRELPLPDGLPGVAVGMSSDGTVVASATADFATFRSFAWNAAGQRTELPPATAGASTSVQAVADGFAIGFEFDPASGASHLLRWNLRTHTVRTVTHLDLVTTVNAHGDYAGQSGSGAAEVRGGRLIQLPGLAAGKASGVVRLADNGLAAGFARDANNAVFAVTWSCHS